MKKLIISLLATLPLMAYASETVYLSDFAQDPKTGKAYSALISSEKLPSWVKGGGTSAPAKEVTINGERYLALFGCKPHDCLAESIAVLYSVNKGDIHGVYSEANVSEGRQVLKWMNLEPAGNLQMRNVLFSTLTGDPEE